MAYSLVRACATGCGTTFKAGSNKQIYCTDCKVVVRKEKNKLWQHDYYMKNQAQKLEQSRAYNKSEKGRAAQKLRDAIRQGKIRRQPCEICQEPEAQGHHFDYSKPLEVRWLCAKHHREEHLFEPWQNDLRRAGYKGGFLLGQLIEACGEDFAGLDRDEYYNDGSLIHVRWNCRPVAKGAPVVVGPTPEEAVALLGLALNKKGVQ